jgi:hypothetical protein
MRRFLLVVLAVAIGAAVVAGCGGSSNPKPTALNLSISEQGKTASFQAPKTTKGGLVDVTLANKGQAPHGVQFIQYTSGHTAADVQKQLGSNSNKVPDWLKAEGGIGMVPGGGTQTATVNLPAGNYVIVDAAAAFGPGSGNAPPATAQLAVSSGETGDLPDTPGKVVANETGKDQFAWDTSGLHTGQNDITFESKGDEALHLVIAVPVNGTAPPLSKIKSDFSKAGNGPPPSYLDFKDAQSSAILDGGLSQTTKLNLQKPGQYIFFCPLSDRDGGKPHDQEGLLKVETIK